MSMHLAPVYYTTLNTRKRKKKKKTASQLAAEKRHEEWLKKLGVDSNYKKEKEFIPYKPEPSYRRETPNYPSLSNKMEGFAPRKERQVYTGDKIIGIATMHKSNAVPITSKEDATNISKMGS